MTEKRFYAYWMLNVNNEEIIDGQVVASKDKDAKRKVASNVRTEMEGGVSYRFGRWVENELEQSDWRAPVYVNGRWAYYVHLKKGDIAV